MNKKSVLIIFLLLTGFLVAGTSRVVVGNTAVTALLAPVLEVVVTPTAYQTIANEPKEERSSWQTYTDTQLGFSIQHPESVIRDPRQTVAGRIIAFVVAADTETELSENVPVLYIADTTKIGSDAFSAFRKGDCGTQCQVSYKKVDWVNINNTFGVKNPMPGDIHNYFLTDKAQTRTVMNVYVGNFTDAKDKTVQEKIKLFEKMIKTFEFTND